MNLKGNLQNEFFFLEQAVIIHFDRFGDNTDWLNLVKAFDNRIIHSLKLINKIFTRMFKDTDAFKKMNLNRFWTLLKVMKKADCRFVTKEVQQAVYNKFEEKIEQSD